MLADSQPIREVTCPQRHSLTQTDDLCQLYEGQSYTENVYFCDTCRNEYNAKSQIASHCKTCGFDLCPNCYEAQKLIQITCPQNSNHALLKVRALQQFSNYASNSYGCHSCGGTFDSSIFPSAHCRPCGYDLCPDCFGHIQLHILNPRQSQINFQPPHQMSIGHSQPQPQPQVISHAPNREEKQPKNWIKSTFARALTCPAGHALQKDNNPPASDVFPLVGFAPDQTYVCRTCNKVKFNTKQQGKHFCEICKFDMCEYCVENQRSVLRLFCPKAHPLMIISALREFAKYNSSIYDCNACGVNFDAGISPAAHCLACSYDLCPRCITSADPGSQKGFFRPSPSFTNVTCPANHSLILVNNLDQLYPDVEGDYAKNMYFCDTCRLTFNCQTDHSRHCQTCGLDLCPSCLSKDSKINFKCSAGHQLYIVSNLKGFHEGTNAYNENKYVCNTCRGSFDATTDPSCHCKPCGFDLCPKCFERRNTSQPTSIFTGLFAQVQAPFLQKPEESKTNQRETATKEPSEEILCMLCLDNKRSYLFNPCNHLCACEKCAVDLMNKKSDCPICRNPIRNFTKVFMP